MNKFLCVLFLLPFILDAQKLNMELLKGMKARSIGPAGMAGRITAIDAVTNDPRIIYAGSASGGLWKSENGGTSWQPVFDEQPTASIGAVAIQQSNPSVIWAGTGEGNPRNSLNSGAGIFKSLDGGKTWRCMGLQSTKHIHRVIIHPRDPDVVFVGAIGSPWGSHPDRGVYKTTDGGITWKQILYTNDSSGCADLVMDPGNPNKLMAAMWQHARQPWFFQSGGRGSGLYITHDGGESWQQRTHKDGLPEGELGRMGLAISRSNPKVVYALIEAKKNGLYRSEDGGTKWKLINDKDEIGNRPFYYSEIYVDPVNEHRIYSLFTYVNVSIDGGKSFEQLMPAYNTTRGVHPDHHAWYGHPIDPNFLIEGNDGGLNISQDRGKTWRFVENLPLAQFYHINVDNALPYNVYGGMQDNGSWSGPAYVWKAQSIRNSEWQEISFGDGFDVSPDPDDYRYGYSMAQEGNLGRYDRLTGYFEFLKPTAPNGEEPLRFNWNAAFAQDKFFTNVIYYGSQFVHKSDDRGKTWKIISPDLTTNDKSKQQQHQSGGLTVDATGAENHCTLITLAPSPVQSGVIWVGTDDGKIQLTRDDGLSWEDVGKNISDLPEGCWINQIHASRYSQREAYVVANDYRRLNHTPYLFHTKDYGQSWKRLVDESDVRSFTLSFEQDPVERKLMFLGSDDGLYVSIDEGENWTRWTNGYPTVPTMDMVIHPREYDLVIGTFGRAAYVLDDIRPLRSLARDGIKILDKPIHVFRPPTAFVATIQQHEGTRFSADAMFAGENRSINASITYSFRKQGDGQAKKSKQKAEDSKADSISIQVIHKTGAVIRTIRIKAPEDDGLNKVFWDMKEKGVYDLTRDALDKKNEPAGVAVLPGRYIVKFTYVDHQDSTAIDVQDDPRLELSNTVLQSRYETLKKLEQDKQEALTRVEKLKKYRNICEELTDRMKFKGEELFEEHLEKVEAVKDTLNYYLDLYLGAEDDRQGITAKQKDHVNYHYQQAYFYVSNARHAPGDTEIALIRKFLDESAKVNKQTDQYLDAEWPKFKGYMEELNLSPFE